MSEQTIAPYPQAKPFTADEAEAFLAKPLIAKLATHNEDGSIHIAPLWFNYEGGDILFGTQAITQKVQNIKRDPRVTVLVDGVDPVLQAVMIYGMAELDYEDVTPKRIALFEKYMSAEEAVGFAESLAATYEPVIIRVKLGHMITFDYSKGMGI
ncbi:MAG: pyridoxamine 5'-phosphate oxidase family protein [Chloroflexota bacterium]|nr:pyridoxamine 5'-phosphate oxidase family protein [Chloroflexota bacterium]